MGCAYNSAASSPKKIVLTKHANPAPRIAFNALIRLAAPNARMDNWLIALRLLITH